MVRPPSRRLVSPFCLSLSLPTCVPVMVCLPDGVSAFSRSCLPLSLLVSPCLPLSPHNIRLCWMACPPSQGLISPCRLPLSPTSLLVSLSWMVCPPFRGLVSPVSTCPPLFPILSHCLPTCVPVLDGVSRPPSRGLVSPSLPLSPLSPIVCPHLCLCWMVHLFDVLSSLFVSHCLRTCVPVLDGASALVCPPSRGLVSSCLPVLDGVSAFPRSCFPLSPISLLVSLCWNGVSAFSTSCLPLSPIVSSHVSLCWMVCRLPQGLVSTCLPFSPIVHPIASHCLPSCLPTCVPVLDVVPAFPRSCLLLSPIVSPHDMCACNVLCWMVRPPSRGFVSPLVSQCLPSCFPLWWVV